MDWRKFVVNKGLNREGNYEIYFIYNRAILINANQSNVWFTL